MNAISRIWPGATVAILGTGPSLSREDVDFVRGRARVIAINDAHTFAPFADVLYSSDQLWWRRHRDVSFGGLKFAIASVKGQKHDTLKVPGLQIVGNTGPLGLETDPTGIRHGKNSGYAAVNLAVHLGAARILLLGYNLGPVNKRVHFNGAPASGCSYDRFARAFDTMVGPLKQIGVDVINCTFPTRLTCFPQASLREALDRQVAA